MSLKAVVLMLATCGAAAPAAQLPLEELQLTGTTIQKSAILAIGGLRIGAPIDRPAIEAACQKLQETGLFAQVGFRYTPGPRHGYVLMLTLVDQPGLVGAVLDVDPALAEETWRWIAASYPRFDHRLPAPEDAQQFILREMERHLGAALEGQHLAGRLESDLEKRTTLVAIQPEHLPAIRTLRFDGLQGFAAQETETALRKALGEIGYTLRGFRSCLESSVRPVFEHHGMYRARFIDVQTRKAGALEIDVTTTIEEGPSYTLGDVRLLGDELPAGAMRKAAGFQTGKLADWTQIQLGIYQSEAPLKRTGYFAARSKYQRIIHDDTHVLDLEISYVRGPLFHFGGVIFTGLAPQHEQQARKLWKAAPGAPYDYAYASEFLRQFGTTAEARGYKPVVIKAKPGAGDHVMDIEVIFAPR